jgi:hypothetical protein
MLRLMTRVPGRFSKIGSTRREQKPQCGQLVRKKASPVIFASTFIAEARSQAGLGVTFELAKMAKDVSQARLSKRRERATLHCSSGGGIISGK